MTSTFKIYAVNPEYHETMLTNIKAMDTTTCADGLISLAGRFEQIAKVETMEWLPLYYASFGYIRASFAIKEEDKRDLIVDKAIELVNNALKLYPTESELYSMMGFAYIAKLNINPMLRAMVYIPKAKDMFGKSREFNPSNPRPYYLLATITFNTPEMFGGGKEKALPELKEAMEKFDHYNLTDSIMPNWGRQHCLSMLEQK